jgi:hypothetical protein
MIEGISVKTVYSKTDQVKLDSGGVWSPSES